jgi:signal transduction histidine kinase
MISLRLLRFFRRSLWVIVPYCVVLGISIYVLEWYEGIYFPYSYDRLAQQAQGGFAVLQEDDVSSVIVRYNNTIKGDAYVYRQTIGAEERKDTLKDTLPGTTIVALVPMYDHRCVVIAIKQNSIRLIEYDTLFRRSQAPECIVDSSATAISSIQVFEAHTGDIVIRLDKNMFHAVYTKQTQKWSIKAIATTGVMLPQNVKDTSQYVPMILQSEQTYSINRFDMKNNRMDMLRAVNADAVPTLMILPQDMIGVIVPTNLRTRIMLFAGMRPLVDTIIAEQPSSVWWSSQGNTAILHRIAVSAPNSRLMNTVYTAQGMQRNTSSIVLQTVLVYPLGFMDSPHGMMVRFINGWAEIGEGGRTLRSADILTSSVETMGSMMHQAHRMATRHFLIDSEVHDGVEQAVLYKRSYHPWYGAKNILTKIWLLVLVSLMFAMFVVIIQKLRQYRRISYAIIKTPSAPITLVVAPNRRISFESAKARELLVRNETLSLQGRKITSLGLDDTGKKVVAMIEQCFRENQNITEDIERIEWDETLQEEIQKVYDCTVSPITSFGNHLRGVLLIGRDVTEEREKKAIEISWSIAHDMQTPLATINMATERLENLLAFDTINVGQLRESTKSIAVQSLNLSKRVKDWKILAGKQIEKPMETNITTLFESIIDAVGPRYYNGVVDFTVNIPDQLTVLCYPDSITSAVHNMIRNSIRSMEQVHLPEKTHVLYIHVYQEQVYPSCLVIEIGDTGEGIKKETLVRLNKGAIVTEFQIKGGTGTGTRIIRECIRKHNAPNIKKMRQASLMYESPAVIATKDHQEVVVATKVTLRLLSISRRRITTKNSAGVPSSLYQQGEGNNV